MKQLLPIIFCIIFLQVSYAQQDKNFKVGLQVAVQGAQYDILVPLKSSSFSIAPSIGVSWNEDAYTEMNLGLVPKFYLAEGKARPYLGGRFLAQIISPKNGDSIIDYLVGLAGGGEYFFDEHLSCGAEAQINIGLPSKNSIRYILPGKTNINTASALFLTYYF